MKRSLAGLLAVGTASVVVGGTAVALAVASEQPGPLAATTPAAVASKSPVSITESPGAPPGLAREIEARYAANRHPVVDQAGTVRGWTTNDVIDGNPVTDAKELGVVVDGHGMVVGYYDGVFVDKAIVDRGDYVTYAASRDGEDELSVLDADGLEDLIKRAELKGEEAASVRAEWAARRKAKQG